jgi:hypothetical protein
VTHLHVGNWYEFTWPEKSYGQTQFTPWSHKDNHYGPYRFLPSTQVLGCRDYDSAPPSSTRVQVSEELPPPPPGAPCLIRHYSEITQQDYSPFDPEITKYIDLIILSELAQFKIDLFKMTPAVLLGSSDTAIQKEIQSLNAQVAAIDAEAEAIRLFLWTNGCDTLELDNHLALCRKSEPGVGRPIPSDAKEVNSQRNGELEVPSSSGPGLNTGMDANKQDRINMWLLRNLQESSEEKTFHRSFLTRAENLDEEKWARLVLKYWWLGDAAVVPENEPLSTNGAVDSAGMCHSVRVIFQGQAVSEPCESVDRKETPLKTTHAGSVRQPKLQTTPGNINKPRWRV